MFERYTEKARRVIFFARYEASEFGSPHIDTEHLLLGLVREQKWVLQLIPNLEVNSLRAKIESLVSVGKKFPTSVDLPLSNESKRVLAYAAEEAERLASQSIAPPHLLLGLVREQGGVAAKVLIEGGANIAELREAVSALPAWDEHVRTDILTIHGRSWPQTVIESRANMARTFFWEQKKFTTPHVVIRRKDKRISFDLQLAQNSSEFELLRGGWKQTVCAICTWQFAESDDPERGAGYTNGRDWICTECYERFLPEAL